MSIATADSSSASHSDLKSQSAWTAQLVVEPLSVTLKNSLLLQVATSEVADSALLYPECKCTASTLEELGYPQPIATGTQQHAPQFFQPVPSDS